jgi:delta-aminolevulinic acid dehydratase/porphobilinogen synthase
VRKYYRFIDGLRKFAKARIEPEEAIGLARTHQMGYSKTGEAIREAALDIVARAKKQFHMPRAVYSESGVDAIIDPAAHMGRQNRDAIMLEALAALR